MIYKKFRLHIPMYGYMVNIIVTDSIEKAANKNGIDLHCPEDSMRAYHSYDPDEPESFLFVRLNSDTNDVVHESVHVMQRIVEWIGAGYKEKEFIAYLTAHIAQAVFEFQAKVLKGLQQQLS